MNPDAVALYGAEACELAGDKLAANTRAENGCLVWTGGVKDRSTGSGTMRAFGGGNWRASVVSWVLAHGPVPEGWLVWQSCRNRACVAPGHLVAGTRSEFAVTRRPVACPRGHVYDEANTLVERSTGRRRCRTCRTGRAAE